MGRISLVLCSSSDLSQHTHTHSHTHTHTSLASVLVKRVCFLVLLHKVAKMRSLRSWLVGLFDMPFHYSILSLQRI